MKGFSSVQQEISIPEIYYNKSRRWIFPLLMGAVWFWLGLSYPETSGTAKIIAFVASMAFIMLSILMVIKRLNYLKVHENGIEIKNGFRKYSISWENINHFGVWKRTLFGLSFGEFVGFDINSGNLKPTFNKKATGFDKLLPGFYGITAPELSEQLGEYYKVFNSESTKQVHA